ncbi:MAG: polyphosphate polymerase domain-containing protein [Firmicutes bacterium]|nr:polyphosphate polymerase domain-containing protein [Bacillota bacterium]
MSQAVFNRYEKKYILPKEIYFELREKIKDRMVEDEYGLSTICNIYYDTADKELIRKSIDKPVYKEKLRIRSYGVPSETSKVFVEIKKKYNKIVNKRRISMPLDVAYRLVEEKDIDAFKGEDYQDKQILAELAFFLDKYDLEKSIYLAYDRIAMKCLTDDFRLTFDTNIRARFSDMGLEKGDTGNLLLPPDYHLMETKILGSTPMWFARIMSDLSVFPTSFSKYGNFYRRSIEKYRPIANLSHRLDNWKATSNKVALQMYL